MANSKDFLCYIPMMTGGSYGRNEDRSAAAFEAFQTFTSDWGSMFDVFGQEVKGYIADVTGFEAIQFGPGKGIWAETEDGSEHLFKLEEISIQMPKLLETDRPSSNGFRRRLKKVVLASK